MDNKKPSIERILWTDYLASVSVISILAIWGFFLFFKFIKPAQLSEPLFYASIAVTLVGSAVLIWRVRLITSAFAEGVEVEGDVVNVSFFRDRGSATYIYAVNGERYKSSNAIMRHRITAQLRQGQKVTIVVNKDNPKTAFIRDLYT
jgi:hypothetical protein